MVEILLRLGLPLSLFFNPIPLPAQNQANAEYRWKADFLSKFPSFVEWPADAIPSGRSSFFICSVGDFPFGISLAESTGGKTFHNHRFEVRWVRKLQDLNSCQILFVSHSEQKRYAQILEAVQGHMVLTVGETPDFLDAGGIVSFFMQEQKLQFDVNLAAATKSQLKMSSQLLALARRVVNPAEAAKS